MLEDVHLATRTQKLKIVSFYDANDGCIRTKIYATNRDRWETIWTSGAPNSTNSTVVMDYMATNAALVKADGVEKMEKLLGGGGGE